MPAVKERYPKLQKQPKRSVARLLREILLSVRDQRRFKGESAGADSEQEELVHEYGAYFEGKSKAELEELAKSFSLCKCAVQ